MSQGTTQNGHKADIEAMTLRLGEPYRDLCEWAGKTGLTTILEIAYHALGLTPNTLAMSNLVEELSNDIAQDILEDWSDHPVAQVLTSFAGEYQNVLDKQTRWRFQIEHSGPATRTKESIGDYRYRTFLLVMITNPLPVTNDHRLMVDRQRLRLWLVVQALERMIEYGYAGDMNISTAARFLIKDHRDTEDWDLIDEVLRHTRQHLGGYTATYERFSDALAWAANEVEPTKGERYRTKNAFLEALQRIARGETAKIEQQASRPISQRPVTWLPTREPPTWFEFEGEEDDDKRAHQVFRGEVEPEIPEDDADVDEDDRDTYVIQINPDKTEEEHAVTGNSFFLYSAEEAHYLPWSWDKPLPHEQAQLEAWVERSLESSDAKQRLGATVTWIAKEFGRSLFFTLKMSVSDEIDDEWVLSLDYASISRYPPRRPNSWHPKSAAEKAQVHPALDTLSLSLPPAITRVLQDVSSQAGITVQTLGDLWRAVSASGEKIEVWFNTQAKEHFPRLKSGMLMQAAGQAVFERTGDPHLARMLSAHPESGLPGACGYASWDITAIEKGLPLSVDALGKQRQGVVALGSLLVPLESLLVQEIHKARDWVQVSTGEDLVRFHNRFARYCVMALYAATGCRHLREPFEALEHFNFEHCLVYINDKSDGGLHSGRIVRLPDRVIIMIKQYLAHLRALAAALKRVRPELSETIEQILDGGSASMPLFFLLDNGLGWHGMTEPDLPGLPIFDCLLPANLFRHRYAQRLSAAGVPIDVIDGWMGHAERGVATYGDYSPRCWMDDAQCYRDAINDLFGQLPFEPISLPEGYTDLCQSVPIQEASHQEPERFGLERRRRERRIKVKRALGEARADITNFLKGNSLADLTAEQVEQLGDRMLQRENGRTHHHAAIRLRELVKQLNSHGNENRRALRRRVVGMQFERSLVKSHLPRALTEFEALQAWKEKTQKIYIKAKLSKYEARCLGTMFLAIEKRLSYRRFLDDLILGNNARLIQHRKRCFIEYSEALDPDDFSIPVQRHEISYKTASLLAYGLDVQSRVIKDQDKLPKCLADLPGLSLPATEQQSVTTITRAFDYVAGVINQVNLVQLPGMVAGALSERQPPTSLPLHDYLRITEGLTVTPPSCGDDQLSSAHDADDYLQRRRLLDSDAQVLQQQAEQCYRAIHYELKDYKPTQKSASQCERAVREICKHYENRVSSAVLLVGYWIASVIERGQGKGKNFKPYAETTPARYFSPLKGAFQHFAYGTDLIALDEDGMTAMLADMLTAMRLKRRQARYFCDRLKEFLRWAARFGVESPDWSELPVDSDTRSVRAGAMSENDYLACQRYIQTHWQPDSDEALFLGFVLLLTFRFGLRSEEARCLRRADFCQTADALWVLVRNNRLRTLKAAEWSRRAVPLLFELTPLEKDLIERVLARYNAITGGRENAPILCEWRDGKVMLSGAVAQIPTLLIRVMRLVTGSPTLVLHHCRHAFYNRLAPALLGIDSPLAQGLTADMDQQTIRRLVLGAQHAISRRSGMALARLMGHVSPHTDQKSYNHLMTDWADALTPVSRQRARVIKGIYSTGQFVSVEPEAPHQTLGDFSYPEPTLGAILRTLRLVAMGKPFERAGELMHLDQACVSILEWLYTRSCQRMRFKIYVRGSAGYWVRGEQYPMGLLHYIRHSAWGRLLEHVEHADSSVLDRVVNLPPLDEIAHMVGRNRHLLMHDTRHCDLVRCCLEYFAIPDNRYHVAAYDDDPETIALLTNAGFSVLPASEASTKGNAIHLDPFLIRYDRHRVHNERHGGMILTQEDSGIIRTSYQLAVAFLAIAALLCTRQTAVSREQ